MRNFLRVLLFILAADAVLGSLLILVGGRAALVRTLPPNGRGQVNELFLLHKLESAGLALGLAVMFGLAALEPEKNRTVIIGSAVGLFAMAGTEILGANIYAGSKIYPATLVWAHALVRVAIASALLLSLRLLGLRRMRSQSETDTI